MVMMTGNPHSSALRRGRVSLPGHIYHLRFVVRDRQPLFSDFGLGRVVAICLQDGAVIGKARSLAWVVMPDHLHWLVQLDEVLGLADLARLDGFVSSAATLRAASRPSR